VVQQDKVVFEMGSGHGGVLLSETGAGV